MENLKDDLLFDYSKLRGRIVEKFKTITVFAEAVGVTKQSISSKLTSGLPFNVAEIIRWMKLLEIDDSDVMAYFFTLQV